MPCLQAAYAPNQVKEGMLLPHPVPDRVMSNVSLDTFHIRKAKGKDGRVYDGVVVCVDRLSGLAIVEPILFEDLTGEKIGNVLVHQWLSVCTVPVEITKDHDPKFTSAWFNTLCSGLGVRVPYRQVNRSQTSGRAEVAGHQIFQILRRIHLEKAPRGIGWVQCIWAVLGAYHQTKGHLGLSPQKLVFGREKLGPAPWAPPRREAVCATQWLQKMRDMDRLAHSLHEQELQKDKQRYNQHRRESTADFAGDSVWVHAQRPHGTNKLAPYWVGQCEVVSRRGRDTCLSNADAPQLVEKHASDLKLYKEPLLGEPIPLSWTRPLTRARIQPVAEMTYPGSKILDHRAVKRHCVYKMEFLLRWQGYSADHDSWKPAENFLPGYNLPWVRYCLEKQIALDISELLPVGSLPRSRSVRPVRAVPLLSAVTDQSEFHALEF